MLAAMEEEAMAMAAAASSECSSGCQSGWTTYLHDDDHSYSSCGTAPLHAKPPCAYSERDCSEEAEEDDLSMISDASSGPLRQQCSAGSDEGAASYANNARAERRGRRVESAARRQSKTSAAAASLLEDTASSPAFFNYYSKSKAMSSAEADGYRCAAPPTMDIDNAADLSCAFSATTGFKSPLNATPLGVYPQVHCSPPAVKPMSTRKVCRENGGKTKRR